MIIHVRIDKETLDKLDRVGLKLNIFTFDARKLINSLCDKTLQLSIDLKQLVDTLLSFIEESNLEQSEIAKLTLKIYNNHFKNS